MIEVRERLRERLRKKINGSKFIDKFYKKIIIIA